jgi:hypothetical protein
MSQGTGSDQNWLLHGMTDWPHVLVPMRWIEWVMHPQSCGHPDSVAGTAAAVVRMRGVFEAVAGSRQSRGILVAQVAELLHLIIRFMMMFEKA